MSRSKTVERATGDESALLRVENVEKYFKEESGIIRRNVDYVKAVDGVSFDIQKGETLGLVGESGCGKSTLGRALLQLHEPTGGSVYFQGNDITSYSGRQLRALRTDVQMIFQDPQSSLDPRMPVIDIITEPLENFDVGTKEERQYHALKLLEDVGLGKEHLSRYRHELSGGQQQRVAIARALALEPELIVADEPTSALDVSVQAKILNLLRELREKYDLTYLFISHDLDAVGYISDRIAVMYAGEIVERAPKEELLTQPRHPYTKALLSANPKPDPDAEIDRIVLSGAVPDPIDPPSGCRFHPRCPFATEACTTDHPALEATEDRSREVACIHSDNLVANGEL
ncbi:ABC transporter ATP-binding protein [Natrialba sp. PRR66]|uniref:ABC transporter ATP-binding protein n=1 Tax=Natrialba sp. PRR66 TaxID=3098146 RepID=UPI002B1D72C5|nr:ABC transporter ATP-binding protein [Natrialba sp. PRR66]